MTAEEFLKNDNSYLVVPHYTNQMLIVDSDGKADSWFPSPSDIFAEDWEVISE